MKIGVNLTLYLIFFIFTVICLLMVHRDYRKGELLSRGTIFVVWLTYLYELALLIYWAGKRAWLFRLPFPLLIGSLLVCTGVIVIMISVWNFRSFDRMSGRQTDLLVTEGIYRFSRNPQNTGWVICSFGICYMGSSGLGVSLSILFARGLHVYIVYMEEPHLIGLYGNEYKNYMASTPRYLGIPR